MEAFVFSRMIARSVGLKAIIISIASPIVSGATIDCVALVFIYKQEVLLNHLEQSRPISLSSFV